MIDLRLTSRGDLYVKKKESLPNFRLEWLDSSLPSFRLRWKQGRTIPLDKNGFKLSFDVSEKENEKAAAIIYNYDEIRQRIVLRLRTELGSVENDLDLGTDLWKMKHKDITKDETCKQVRSIVIDAIGGLLPNPDVIVKVARTNGPFYCSNLNVYVMTNGYPFYNFSLKEAL